MPPIKARAIAPPGEEPNAANFLSIKNMIPRKKKPGRRPKSRLVSRDGLTFTEDGMRKLRIPNYISSHLPSVKRFSGGGGGDYVDLTDDTAEIVLQVNRTNVVKRETDISVLSSRPGKSRRRRTASGGVTAFPDSAKYAIGKVCEHKFASMVFDLAFAPGGALLISCDDGVYMCAADFSSITKLDNVLMGGGIAFLSDGKMAVVCRNQDTVNLFMSGGTFLRSFVAGHCPLAIAVNSQDEIVVTDVGPKCIYVFGENGTRRQTLPLESSDGGCKLKWPQYVAVDSSDNIFVTDTHLQKVVQFDATGRHMKSMSLRTSGVNTLLKPTGICIGSDNDFFIVDDSLRTVEVFHDGETFVQTLVHADQGAVLRPKSLRVSADGKHILIGGVFSSVWLYKFLPTVVSPPSPAVKQEPVQVKEELPDDDYNAITLD